MVHSFIVQSPSVQTVHRQMVHRLIKLSQCRVLIYSLPYSLADPCKSILLGIKIWKVPWRGQRGRVVWLTSRISGHIFRRFWKLKFGNSRSGIWLVGYAAGRLVGGTAGRQFRPTATVEQFFLGSKYYLSLFRVLSYALYCGFSN